MNPIASLHVTLKGRLVNSALTPHLDAFAAHLERGRYAANTTKGYVAGIAHFACSVEADLAMKDRALARLQEPDTKIRRYHAPDSLLAFLKTL